MPKQKTSNDDMQQLLFPGLSNDEYFKEPVCFKECDDHYELIYTGEFESVGRESSELTKLMQDLKDGDKSAELHILINSIGGDVESLSMVLQQVLQYRHRVTVCCGAALSAGFILWACGHERYVSPYSELMYHTIYSGYEGKGVELSSYGKHVETLTDRIMEAVGMNDLISAEDMQRGKSTEVWYTGEDFIKSGKARDYSEYISRRPPVAVTILLAGNRFFASSGDKYVELVIDAEHEYGYEDLMNLPVSDEEEQEAVVEQSSSSSAAAEAPKAKRMSRNRRKNRLEIR